MLFVGAVVVTSTSFVVRSLTSPEGGVPNAVTPGVTLPPARLSRPPFGIRLTAPVVRPAHPAAPAAGGPPVLSSFGVLGPLPAGLGSVGVIDPDLTRLTGPAAAFPVLTPVASLGTGFATLGVYPAPSRPAPSLPVPPVPVPPVPVQPAGVRPTGVTTVPPGLATALGTPAAFGPAGAVLVALDSSGTRYGPAVVSTERVPGAVLAASRLEPARSTGTAKPAKPAKPARFDATPVTSGAVPAVAHPARTAASSRRGDVDPDADPDAGVGARNGSSPLVTRPGAPAPPAVQPGPTHAGPEGGVTAGPTSFRAYRLPPGVHGRPAWAPEPSVAVPVPAGTATPGTAGATGAAAVATVSPQGQITASSLHGSAITASSTPAPPAAGAVQDQPGPGPHAGGGAAGADEGSPHDHPPGH